MKVLREGKSWILEHECTGWGNGGKGCGALLGLSRSDLRYFEGVPGDSWGSREPAVMFKCPCCGQCTDLGISDWPRSANTLERWTKGWMLDRDTLSHLGAQYGFLNWVEHETPRSYFVQPLDSFTDTQDVVELRESVTELHTLLRAIYEKLNIY